MLLPAIAIVERQCQDKLQSSVKFEYESRNAMVYRKKNVNSQYILKGVDLVFKMHISVPTYIVLALIMIWDAFSMHGNSFPRHSVTTPFHWLIQTLPHLFYMKKCIMY